MIPQILSDQQAALNLFVLKWGWQIDHSRLEHYLAMSQVDRTQFKLRFNFALNHSPSNKSAPTHFDCLTSYTPSQAKINLPIRIVEWLQN